MLNADNINIAQILKGISTESLSGKMHQGITQCKECIERRICTGIFTAVSKQRTRQYTTREDGAMDIEQGDTGSPNSGSFRLRDAEVVVAVVERKRKW